ncbi:hypothetical protein GGTG_04008 [Gaeumannomyces tritici R3-111a-1]|uniref:Uncharacterized protein n=1 Tax=Gaeumannomyces tritici (strain R3-111a-1) TaxID=644352 RepID=J3NRW0_GAET3|nr:hypothetical protein GGTG_04008 [Gaeumannomyces tritici R3-111a-1]EJT78916.1 hypothetical protein GGTG_04008 [Gaeumannomyces tritici R3-111a-1]
MDVYQCAEIMALDMSIPPLLSDGIDYAPAICSSGALGGGVRARVMLAYQMVGATALEVGCCQHRGPKETMPARTPHPRRPVIASDPSASTAEVVVVADLGWTQCVRKAARPGRGQSGDQKVGHGGKREGDANKTRRRVLPGSRLSALVQLTPRAGSHHASAVVGQEHTQPASLSNSRGGRACVVEMAAVGFLAENAFVHADTPCLFGGRVVSNGRGRSRQDERTREEKKKADWQVGLQYAPPSSLAQRRRPGGPRREERCGKEKSKAHWRGFICGLIWERD